MGAMQRVSLTGRVTSARSRGTAMAAASPWSSGTRPHTGRGCRSSRAAAGGRGRSPAPQQAADEVYVAVADGSGRTQLTHLWDGQASPASAALGRPSWSPDGTQLAFDRSRAATVGHAEVWTTDAVVLPVAGGQPRALALPDLSALFAWRPAPPLRDADAAARPCTLHAPKRGGTLRSGSLDDLILGSERRDVIHGRPGNDWIEGGSGDDVLAGGPGRDDLWPGPGTDRVLARDGKRDTSHCGDLRQATVIADPIDQPQGNCRRVER